MREWAVRALSGRATAVVRMEKKWSSSMACQSPLLLLWMLVGGDVVQGVDVECLVEDAGAGVGGGDV